MRNQVPETSRRRLATLGLLASFELALPCFADSVVVFHEIMYHPLGEEANLEWVELHNQMAVDVDISGWYFSEGIEYSFPEGTVIPGGGFIVVASSPAALAGATGLSGIRGPFSGRLDNAGERLELKNNSGRILDWVRYRDAGDWPAAADGSGSSLAKRDPDLASPSAASWSASAEVGGTPGEQNFPAAGGSGLFPDGLVSYWNLDQASGQLVDIADGNNGSAGATARRVAGIIGSGAISFDNTTGAYISVGTGTGGNYSVQKGITIEALIKSTWSAAALDEDTIFRKEDGATRILLAFQNDDASDNRDVPLDPPAQPVLSFGINVGGAYGELDMPLDGAGGRPSLATLTDGEPHHVAATYDVATGRKVIYFDGTPRFQHSFAAGTPVASGGTTTAYIGNMSGRSRPFTGVIDEVTFWNEALSASEVAAHFETFSSGRNYFDEKTPDAAEPRLAFSEYFTSSASPSWIEIVNLGDAPAALGGHVIAVAEDPSRACVLPAKTLAPGAFAVHGDAELGFHISLGDKVFLFLPERTGALDGVEIDQNHEARHPPGTGRWLYSPRPTPGAANHFEFRDEIVINEIMYHHRVIQEGGSVRESPEAWIELYNKSSGQVDLTGWHITDGVEYRFEDGTVLGPGQYLVVAADKDALAEAHPAIRIVGNFTGRLSHKDDRIVLEDPVGNPADVVHYQDGGSWPGYADGGGSSLELRDPRADNSRPEAWAASDEGSKSSWRTYSYRATASQRVGPSRWNELVVGLLDSGEALVDDFSVVESPDTAPKEYLQNGGFEPDVRSWRLLGTHRHSEVIADPDAAGGHVLHLVATGPTEHMHNHLETTYKSNASIVPSRQYEVSFRARWLAGSNQLNTRLYFNRAPKTTILDVPPLNGTPGARNSTYEANIGPTFENLSHSPIVPDASEDVTVRLEASDPDGVASATLWWNVGGGGWSSTPMEAGSDGSFEGTIPGQAAAALVQFHVEARDGAGAASTFPEGGPDSRALYRVFDAQGRKGKPHVLRILMLPADAAFLHLQTNVMSNDYLPCTVVYDERMAAYDCGVRLKGSERGRPISGRVGFHLKLPPDRAFRGVHDRIQIDRSGGWWSGGPSGQDEILIKHTVNHAGDIPGMYDDIVRVIAPRSEQNGPALLIMGGFGDVFLDSQWPGGGDGTKFKLELIYYPTSTVDGGPESLKLPQPDDVIGSDLTDLGNDKEAYRWTMLIENNEDKDDYSRLIALCKAMSTSQAQLDAATKAAMDVDQWMRTFTIISLFGVTDTYTQGNNHNNVFYVRPSDQRMLAFPWDLDFAWVRSTSSPLYGDQNLARVISLPQNLRLYYGHLLDIIDTSFNLTYLTPWASHYAELAEENYSQLLNYISQRRNHVLSAIPGRIAFAITTNGGADFSVSQTTAVLEGNGWYDVRAIQRGGREEPLSVAWTSATKWRVTVDLDFGENSVFLFAVDHHGEVVGSDTVKVTSTAGAPAPRVSSVTPAIARSGELVSLAGAGFQSLTEVFFGAAESPRVLFDGPAALRAEVPALTPGPCALTARNPDGRTSTALEFTVREPPLFVRGDSSKDGSIDLQDALQVLLHLYAGLPLECPDAADFDDDEALDITDPIGILNYLFRKGPAPRPPFPAPGLDPSGSTLGC